MSRFLPPNVHLFKLANGHPDDEDGPRAFRGRHARRHLRRRARVRACSTSRSLGGAAFGLSSHGLSTSTGRKGARAFLGCRSASSTTGSCCARFSIGIGDTIADKQDDGRHRRDHREWEEGGEGLVERRGAEGQLECQPGHTMPSRSSASSTGVLNKARDTAGTRAQKSLKERTTSRTW